MTQSESSLPGWDRVLAVVAHPDDESFGLGALLSTFVDGGARVGVVCFTHGEASTLHGVDGDLGAVRAGELAHAGEVLGLDGIQLLDYQDGALQDVDVAMLSAHVVAAARQLHAQGLVVFDTTGITGHPDHMQATAAALSAADELGIGVLAWTLPNPVAAALSLEFGPGFVGRAPDQIDLVLPVDRTRQRRAVDCHPSQAVPGSALWRRLDLLGGEEHVRWLRDDESPEP